MSDTPSTVPERLRRDFESAWRQALSRAPRLDDYLAQLPETERLSLLPEMRRLDSEFRRQLASDISELPTADFPPAANEMVDFETTHPAVPKLSIPVRTRGAATARRPAIRQIKSANNPKQASAGKPSQKDNQPATAKPQAPKANKKPGEMTPIN